MQRGVLAAAAILVLTGTAAIAADLPVSVAAPPPLAPRTWDWNGFYGGINAGYGFGKFQNTWSIPPVSVTGVDSGTFNGPLGGIQAGWNVQYSVFLIGVEADVDYAGETAKQTTFNSGFTTTNDPGVTGTISVPHSYTLNWIGTVRGRWGLAYGPALLYGTGGLAWGADKEQVSATATGTVTVGGQPVGNSSTTAFMNQQNLGTIRLGWTAGGGAELALDNNWTIRAEYLYVDLGTANRGLVTQGGFQNPQIPTQSFLIAQGQGTVSTRTRDNIVRVGIDYKFAPF